MKLNSAGVYLIGSLSKGEVGTAIELSNMHHGKKPPTHHKQVKPGEHGMISLAKEMLQKLLEKDTVDKELKEYHLSATMYTIMGKVKSS